MNVEAVVVDRGHATLSHLVPAINGKWCELSGTFKDWEDLTEYEQREIIRILAALLVQYCLRLRPCCRICLTDDCPALNGREEADQVATLGIGRAGVRDVACSRVNHYEPSHISHRPALCCRSSSGPPSHDNLDARLGRGGICQAGSDCDSTEWARFSCAIG
jgi:hypothetical protein